MIQDMQKLSLTGKQAREKADKEKYKQVVLEEFKKGTEEANGLGKDPMSLKDAKSIAAKGKETSN